MQKPGRMMASKLRTYLRPKCHPILLDGHINSPATVRLNIYQVGSQSIEAIKLLHRSIIEIDGKI